MFVIIHNVAQLSTKFFILGTKVCLWDFLVLLSILILLGDCYEYRNFYSTHVRQEIVMSFRAGMVPDVMCVL